VLESNRDLVLRRLTECLGRDRTKHQVAEVTSLGLVQMTRKRVGQGLLEVFSEPCEHCRGRGVVVHTEPVDEKRRGGGGNGSAGGSSSGGNGRRDRSGGRDTAKETAKEPAKETAKETVADVVPDAGSADDDDSGRSSRRGRGRRGRGQAGEERAAEDAAALTAADTSPDTSADPAQDSSPAREAVAAALDAQVARGADATDVVALADLPQLATAPDGAEGTGRPAAPLAADATAGSGAAPDEPPVDAPAARPRRRRAASRPAGPPV
jgi:ribonuclease E